MQINYDEMKCYMFLTNYAHTQRYKLKKKNIYIKFNLLNLEN